MHAYFHRNNRFYVHPGTPPLWLVPSLAPSVTQARAGFGRTVSISRGISRNRSLDTATPASRNVTWLLCLTTFAPILTSFTRGVVS